LCSCRIVACREGPELMKPIEHLREKTFIAREAA
jgi:hypothetical protein